MSGTRAELVQFVRDALIAGHSRVEIRTALLDAGWQDEDADGALSAFADTPFLPPIPRPRPFVSGRDALIYGLAFLALCIVISNLVSVLFEGIEALLREETRSSFRRESWSIAAIMVFTPLFLRIEWRSDRNNPVRKIFSYAALFFAALALLLTLVSVIALALSGGLVLEIALKAAVIALIAAGVGYHYLADLRADAGAVEGKKI
ncbi:DUF5671 domain-containing protein [Palleronia caenipelagi]|uniref:DUF5671 domain-containing protein n=1 Tax=Palleronia caenipelagi TaxID=2489174 RepID=A0A547Q5M5_9RHOB|nr:DUF5671 domain-containing protein [Palleronia caenipelagi]TRD21690.1 hypothetical protein FEV53_08085 [Palleronia caenipelagi]